MDNIILCRIDRASGSPWSEYPTLNVAQTGGQFAPKIRKSRGNYAMHIKPCTSPLSLSYFLCEPKFVFINKLQLQMIGGLSGFPGILKENYTG